MPGTAHRVVDNEPVRERAAIVGAMGADREHVGAAAHQQHRLVADVADELAAIGEFGERNSLRQIGAGRLRLIFGHSVLPAVVRARASRRGDFHHTYAIQQTPDCKAA